MSENLPEVSPALVEYLNRLYPERCPEPSWSERQVWIKVGERNVARQLIHIAEEQEKDFTKVL